MKFSLLACVAVLSLSATAASARVVESEQDVPVTVKDLYGKTVERAVRLTVFVDDETPVPHAILLVNHGRAGTAQERADFGRARYADISRHFARYGFLVALPTRVGYGVTGGDDVEDSGGCTSRRFLPGFTAAAAQTQAVLDVLATRPDVLRDRTVLLGQSYGGATTVALASKNLPGVVAAINIAGGAGGDPKARPRDPCSPSRLESLYGDFGETARVPMLWLYTENDLYWGPELPKAWFKAYRAHGAPAQMVQFPPHGEDGHGLFTRFPDVWKPAVEGFLREQGFKLEPRP
jgi:dienelactone hydrolase